MKTTTKACIFVLFISSLWFPGAVSAQERGFEYRLGEIVGKYDFVVEVEIVPNRETNLQDILVSPPAHTDYAPKPFIYAVTYGIAELTGGSLAYQLFFGMVVIDTGKELYAISTKNCRKAFEFDTIEEQSKILERNLKKLRYE